MSQSTENLIARIESLEILVANLASKLTTVSPIENTQTKTSKKITKSYKKKKTKDPNAPKKNQSAYNLFCASIKETLKQHEPKHRFPVQAGLWAEEKKNSVALEEWQAKAVADKIRFQKETAEYKSTSDNESVVAADQSGEENTTAIQSGNESPVDLFGSDSN